MARTPQNLDVRQIASVDLTEIYPSTAVTTVGMSLILTNAAASANSISVFHNDGSTDRLVSIRTIVGGVGKSLIVPEVSVLKINPGDSIKIKASAATAFNSNLSGSKIT